MNPPATAVRQDDVAPRNLPEYGPEYRASKRNVLFVASVLLLISMFGLSHPEISLGVAKINFIEVRYLKITLLVFIWYFVTHMVVGWSNAFNSWMTIYDDKRNDFRIGFSEIDEALRDTSTKVDQTLKSIDSWKRAVSNDIEASLDKKSEHLTSYRNSCDQLEATLARWGSLVDLSKSRQMVSFEENYLRALNEAETEDRNDREAAAQAVARGEDGILYRHVGEKAGRVRHELESERSKLTDGYDDLTRFPARLVYELTGPFRRLLTDLETVREVFRQTNEQNFVLIEQLRRVDLVLSDTREALNELKRHRMVKRAVLNAEVRWFDLRLPILFAALASVGVFFDQPLIHYLAF